MDDLNISLVHIKSDYIEAYDFEIFDIVGFVTWCRTHRHILYLLLSLYLLAIYFGRLWMKDRPPYKLNNLLFIWNLALAVFSILATIRALPETMYLLGQPNGFYLASCSEDFSNYATMYWGFLFFLSKFLEFGDTAFIILRKQKLIVLHWFHHLSMAYGCWLAFEFLPAGGRFFFINTFVHSFMYSYYAAKALKIKIPKIISMALTLLQIFQMIVSVTMSLMLVYTLVLGKPCRLNMQLVNMAVCVLSIYLILFINFFTQTYLRRKSRKVD